MMSIAGAALRRTERSMRVLLFDSQYGDVSQGATEDGAFPRSDRDGVSQSGFDLPTGRDDTVTKD